MACSRSSSIRCGMARVSLQTGRLALRARRICPRRRVCDDVDPAGKWSQPQPLVLFDRWGAFTWNMRRRCTFAGLQLITLGDGGAREHPSRVVDDFHMQLRLTYGSLSAGCRWSSSAPYQVVREGMVALATRQPSARGKPSWSSSPASISNAVLTTHLASCGFGVATVLVAEPATFDRFEDEGWRRNDTSSGLHIGPVGTVIGTSWVMPAWEEPKPVPLRINHEPMRKWEGDVRRPHDFFGRSFPRESPSKKKLASLRRPFYASSVNPSIDRVPGVLLSKISATPPTQSAGRR
jgi:hypothetical protein